MSDEDIGFNKDFPLKPGVVEEVMPGLRRILCDNPGPFSFTGTVCYIVGKGKVAVIDPGPDDAAHARTILDAVRGETVTHIFVTHTHMDHSPNVPGIKQATGASVYADGNPLISRFIVEGEKRTSEAGGDTSFVADVKLADGQVVEGDGWSLQAVATPGHASNHMAFAWREKKILFSGDHVMGWSTSIVSPPDGSMLDYMASLEKLLHREEDLYFCGHGPQVPDARRYVRFLQRHRKAREESILHRLAKGPCDIPTIVRASYIGIDPRLVQAAGRSVFAHLEDLVARKVVATEGEPSIDGTYRLAGPLA
jgi:glyoxylase-like metal-dependent hydrolase (beta-lactamase superfamily II)